ncbi:hypothetical protein KAFR_0C00340 [Kazachstania africana CBS 2517]|uniref:C2H2-type domain-containing protein n=1 Tax=Kazachstania africana (strain ATCC 22294 / BCRC 22015 / CBS 2517 / CECT 1963 / NBRC 1671 / NRRL Y-8276) TaxID=1071382 RepID=H2ARN0_KAZAF|nr:hypothetical protein KAFR_0C00340 [Kazachstania africana CBS 2517]CCF57030.1 hypothetical protein KAFR_0C00340 [Kazachstania africana CBS 2517]
MQDREIYQKYSFNSINNQNNNQYDLLASLEDENLNSQTFNNSFTNFYTMMSNFNKTDSSSSDPDDLLLQKTESKPPEESVQVHFNTFTQQSYTPLSQITKFDSSADVYSRLLDDSDFISDEYFLTRRYTEGSVPMLPYFSKRRESDPTAFESSSQLTPSAHPKVSNYTTTKHQHRQFAAAITPTMKVARVINNTNLNTPKSNLTSLNTPFLSPSLKKLSSKKSNSSKVKKNTSYFPISPPSEVSSLPTKGRYTASTQQNEKKSIQDLEISPSTDKVKYCCKVCSKRFKRPSSLSTHMNIHTGYKPYQCPFSNCQKSFNAKSNMLRHYKLHFKLSSGVYVLPSGEITLQKPTSKQLFPHSQANDNSNICAGDTLESNFSINDTQIPTAISGERLE